jgi:S1-C subfamily serine protease
MSFRKTAVTAFVTLLMAAGFLGGLIVSGRLALTSSSDAAPEPQAKAPSTASSPVSGVLPDLSSVAERAVKASVNISALQPPERVDPFFQMFYGVDSVQQPPSLGSGVIASPDGFVLTNSHVVQSRQASVRVTLSDSRELEAEVVGVDELTDLAVLKITVSGATTLPWGDSSQLRIAEWVLAIGNPFALSETVTAGIVSAVNRHAPQLDWYNDFIQTDAAINPGNSGGPLVNTRGELIGINTMIYSQTGGYQGIGFAIPSNLARNIMTQLQKTGEIVRGSIGAMDLRPVDEQVGGQRVQGIIIRNMYRNEPAFRSGLRPGDVITTFNGTPIKDASQFTRLVIDTPVNSVAKVEVYRNGQRRSFEVPVAKMAPLRRRM